MKIGLVDQIGGMDDAIKSAAAMAKIKEYKTQDFPEYEKDFRELFGALPMGKSKGSLIKEELGEEAYNLLEQVKRINSRKGMQLVLPYEININ